MGFKYQPQGQRLLSRGKRWWRIVVSVAVALGFIAGVGYWFSSKRKPKKTN